MPPAHRNRKPVHRKKRRNRQILLIVIFLAIVLALVLGLKSCLGKSDHGNYALQFSSQSIVVGETAQATVTGLSDGDQSTVVWSSSDTSVVTVNGPGLLTAKKSGTATIAATFGDNSLSGTVMIINTAQGVEDLKLDQNAVSIISGETQQLNAQVTMKDGMSPAQVTWSSSDTSIAVVSASGLVTARDVGTATITATCGDHSVMCTVTVAENTSATKHDESLTTGQTADEEGSEPETTSDTTSQQTSNQDTGKQSSATSNTSDQSSTTADTGKSTSSGSVAVTGAVRLGNVWGTQFHPEKSGDAGLRLLKAFSEL